MITLEDVAKYIKNRKANKDLAKVLQTIDEVFNFKQERDNRAQRFVMIVRAYTKGIAVQEIMDEQDCSRQTVLRYARLAGLPKRPKHFPKEIRKAVITDYKNDIPVAKIAKLHNVSEAYVSKIATEEGISRYQHRREQ